MNVLGAYDGGMVLRHKSEVGKTINVLHQRLNRADGIIGAVLGVYSNRLVSKDAGSLSHGSIRLCVFLYLQYKTAMSERLRPKVLLSHNPLAAGITWPERSSEDSPKAPTFHHVSEQCCTPKSRTAVIDLEVSLTYQALYVLPWPRREF